MVTSKDTRYYDMALRVARLSNCKSQHGAVIVRSGCVLSLACNRLTTHPITRRHKEFSTSIHAEQRSIILAGTDVSRATLYSARYNGMRLGMPCAMCRELMQDANIDSVVFWDGGQLVKERLP
jgi:deoxycytidylate deaminase